VAVVDLIGGGEFRREAAKPPEPPPAPAIKEKAPPARKAGKAASPPPATKGKAPRKAVPVAAPDEFTASKRRAPDTSSVEERLRQMREARAESDAVREAVQDRRREVAARAAVRSVGERVAHRIEAPPPVRNAARGAAGGGGGAQGTVRLSPELLDYFSRLEEKVRSSWVPPGHVRNAAKLMVKVLIVMKKDGKVSDARIVDEGSGNKYFDDSVLRAIRKASPLPVPPEQLLGGEDHYEVGFRFHGSEEAG
jgi:TonB family protein